ncbi:MAG: pyrrolo-quinoline quinone [Steroidobacterales bacterium]|jgi:hypothetical protein
MVHFAPKRHNIACAASALAALLLTSCGGGHASGGAGGNLPVNISPLAASLTVSQVIRVTATTQNGAGVTWSLSSAAGSISPATSASGTAVTLTAPSAAGVYTLTATNTSDKTLSTVITVAVTDLGGVFTWHNDQARDGANTQEYALTTANVNAATFGKLFSCPVDGAVYAQPLWVANLPVAGATHNVLFAATEHDGIYAFDADANPCAPLWKASLIDAAHGGLGGETPVAGNLVGSGAGDLAPEVGVTGTPVIDAAAGILYVVSKSVDSTATSFYQRLHAIDLATGNEKPGSPVTIAATYPGSGDGGTTTTFNAQQQNQRAGLALVGGTIYISWASHEDNSPYYGWVAGYTYNGTAFTQAARLNVTPNVGFGGIWMSGGAPSADSAGHLYLITGNGTFDATHAGAPNNDYGDSLLQLTSGLAVSSYFTPSDEAMDAANDADFGSGGAALVLNRTSGSPQHLVVGGGKDGALYLLNGDSLGGFGDGNARQSFNIGAPIFATGAFWNGSLYLAGLDGPLRAYAFDSASEVFNTASTSASPTAFGFPGSSPSVSASGATSNGIVWALDSSQFCTPGSPGCAAAVLHAYDASNLASELWNSSLTGADAAGFAVKFTVPTVANGKVYIGTRGNNSGGASGSSSVAGEIDVYGLKQN